MLNKKAVCDDLDWASDRLSTQVRTVAIGILALSWGLLVGESAQAKAVASLIKWQLLYIGELAVGVLLLDFFQYVCYYAKAWFLLRKMDREKVDEGQYGQKSFLLRCQNFCFVSKQVLTVVAAFWFLVALAYRIWEK